MNIPGATVRPFEEGDYVAWVDMVNSTYRDSKTNVEEMKHQDRARSARYRSGRIVATVGGEVVAGAHFDQVPWMYHPRKFFLHGIVSKAFRARGIGAALHDEVMKCIAAFEPIAVRSSVKESEPEGVKFLVSRGYVEERRTWESELDLTTFDASRFKGAEERVTGAGIEIRTLAELSGTDTEWQRKFFELGVESGRDVPRPDVYTYPTLEEYRRIHFESPSFLADGSLVAVHEGKYVGLSDLEDKKDPGRLDTGYTGTLREYRGRGIGLALKLRAIAYARSRGTRSLTTGNDSTNARMLAINDALGFQRKPAWVGLVKVLKEE